MSVRVADARAVARLVREPEEERLEVPEDSVPARVGERGAGASGRPLQVTALGVSDAERLAPPAPTTLAFQNFMADAASSGRYELLLAVLVVAEWSYLSWAAPHHPPRPDLPFWYREWIELHAGVEFEAVVEYLRGQLDSVWATLGEAAQGDVEQVFRTAVRLEREFFDAAYRPT